MKILDLGSGKIPKLVSNYLEVEVTACDINPSKGVEVQNMESLTYPDHTFDLVMCINALDHTKDAEAALQEILRVTKKDGSVYINCALDQLTRHRMKHYWDAKADGVFVNSTAKFDLKDYGFDVECINGRMIARW